MKKYFLILASLLFLTAWTGAQAAETKNGLTWYTNLAEAQKLSASSKKPIFGFFTGSDWCGWCRKLQADVFSKKEFISWAQKNVILLELDFPRNKELSADLRQQNTELQQIFSSSRLSNGMDVFRKR
jgi:thiol:disulfide interchange protein